MSFFESDEYLVNKESTQAIKRANNYSKMLWRIFQVFVVILLILAFQICSIIALEMNVQVVIEEDDSNKAIPKLVAKMTELSQLNDLKPKFMMEFESQQGVGSVEFPGAQYYDNFQYLPTDLTRVYKSQNEAGIQNSIFPEFMPLVPFTDLSNTYLYENSKANTQYPDKQIVPLKIRDSQDLNSIKINSQLLFDSYIDFIVDADFKQAKFMNQLEDKNDAKHQQYDFSSIENEIDLIGHQSTKTKCWEINDTTAEAIKKFEMGMRIPDQGQEPKDNFNSTKEINPGICNAFCRPSDGWKFQSVRTDQNFNTQNALSKFNDKIEPPQIFCECWKADPRKTELKDKTQSEYDCIHANKAIVNPSNNFAQIVPEYLSINTTTKNQYKMVQDYKSLIVDKEDIESGKSFLKTWVHDSLKSNSLTGSFIKPLHIKHFKFCNASFQNYEVTNISIDFQADLIAYPILLDTQSSSMAIHIGQVDLESKLYIDHNFTDAFQENISQQIKNLIQSDEKININKCANNCKAQDQFLLNHKDNADPQFQCICLSEQDRATKIEWNLFEFNKEQFIDQYSYDNPKKDYFGNTKQGNRIFSVYQFKGQTSEYNHISFNQDPQNNIFPTVNQSETIVTAARTKVVVQPQVDKELNCIYKADVYVELHDEFDMVFRRKMQPKSLDLKSRIQYTMINNKTVFVCVPPVDSFDQTLTIYPQFEEFPEYDKEIRDMSYFFGDTLPYAQEGCPKVKEWADYLMKQHNDERRNNEQDLETGELLKKGPDPQPDYWKDDIETSKQSAKTSDQKLPRTNSNEKVQFTYLTFFKEKLDLSNITKQQLKDKLNNKYNFQPDNKIITIQNVTMVFCFVLVFLSIFEESNESLFCMQVTTRLQILYCIKKDTPLKQRLFNGLTWFLIITFSILRIGYTTTKILIVILLMNWNTNIDALMMNSLALIFVLELDSISQAWLFDTNKGIEISCENFLDTYTKIKIQFNLRYQVPTFLQIFLMQITGIQSYKYPTQTAFEIFTNTLDNLLKGNHYDSTVLWQAVLQVFSFGSLFEECSFRLYNVTKTKNLHFSWLIIMFIAVLIVMYATVVSFVQSDYDFQVRDFLMCLKNNNKNCANSQEINDSVWSKNLSLLQLTPVYFIISIPLNLIFTYIWSQYTIDKKIDIENKIELAKDNENYLFNTIQKDKPSQDNKQIWMLGKNIALQNNSLMDNQEEQLKARKSTNFNDLSDECKVLCVQIENGGEVPVDLDSFAKFNSISKKLAQQVANRKIDVNTSMKEFNTNLLWFSEKNK